MDSLIDINTLAETLALKPQTIRNRLSNGTWPLPTYKLNGKLVWKDSEVQDYLSGLEKIN